MKPQTKAIRIAGEAEQAAACPPTALPRFLHWSSRLFHGLHPAEMCGHDEPHGCQMVLKLGLAEEGDQAYEFPVASCRCRAPLEWCGCAY